MRSLFLPVKPDNLIIGGKILPHQVDFPSLMAILKSAKVAQRHTMEDRRRHQRSYVGIPMTYQVQVPESPEISWIGSGVVRNVSYTGLYFRSSDTPPLEEGHIRNFTFTSTKEHPTFPETDLIIAKGRVVRIDAPEPGHQDPGVAIEFVSVKFIPFLQRKAI
jgi:hypothetical protein